MTSPAAQVAVLQLLRLTRLFRVIRIMRLVPAFQPIWTLVRCRTQGKRFSSASPCVAPSCVGWNKSRSVEGPPRKLIAKREA